MSADDLGQSLAEQGTCAACSHDICFSLQHCRCCKAGDDLDLAWLFSFNAESLPLNNRFHAVGEYPG